MGLGHTLREGALRGVFTSPFFGGGIWLLSWFIGLWLRSFGRAREGEGRRWREEGRGGKEGGIVGEVVTGRGAEDKVGSISLSVYISLQ